MKFIFWTCFSWICSCSIPHNQFIFCSTWISKTSGVSLASYREWWLATQNGSRFKISRNRIQPRRAKCNAEERAWSRCSKNLSLRDQLSTSTPYTPLLCWYQSFTHAQTPGAWHSRWRLLFRSFLCSWISPPLLLSRQQADLVLYSSPYQHFHNPSTLSSCGGK
jgi:hypothetical protein